MGSPTTIRHLTGAGNSPTGPSQGKVGVMGKCSEPTSLPSIRERAKSGLVSSAPMMAVGMMGAPELERELHVAATAKALQLIAIAKQLARALSALGEGHHELVLRKQSLGVLLASPHRPQSIHEYAQERIVKDRILRQPAHGWQLRTLHAHRGAQHEPIPGHRARAIGHDQGAPLRGQGAQPSTPTRK